MTEIYTASPLQAFFTNIITVIVLFVIGLSGLGTIFRRQAAVWARALGGMFGLALICASLAVSTLTVYQYTSGTQTLTARLTQKQIARSSDSNGNPVDNYRLFFGNTATFDVERSAYDKLTQGGCYQVVYYPSTGILGLFGVSTAPPLQSGAIASIHQPNANQCR